MSYGELNIELLDVDESLLKENWKLLGWRYSDAKPRGVVDKELQELAEFPLNSQAANTLYLKLPATEATSNPTMTLDTGIEANSKAFKQVTIEPSPVQNAIFGREMVRFLKVLENLNKEVEAYLKLPDKERKYDLLKDLIERVNIELDFYTTDERYTKVVSSYKSDATVLFKTIPRESGVNLEKDY